MDGWGVGTSVSFMVGDRCRFSFWREKWGGGQTGGSVGNDFGADPCLRLYWFIF